MPLIKIIITLPILIPIVWYAILIEPLIRQDVCYLTQGGVLDKYIKFIYN